MINYSQEPELEPEPEPPKIGRLRNSVYRALKS